MVLIVALGQQYHVGEKPTVLLCTLTLIAMQEHRTKTKTKDTMSVDYSSICYIGSMGSVGVGGGNIQDVDVETKNGKNAQ